MASSLVPQALGAFHVTLALARRDASLGSLGSGQFTIASLLQEPKAETTETWDELLLSAKAAAHPHDCERGTLQTQSGSVTCQGTIWSRRVLRARANPVQKA